MLGGFKKFLKNFSPFQSAVHPFSGPSKEISIIWTLGNMFRFGLIKRSQSFLPSPPPLLCPVCLFTAPPLSLHILLRAHINFLRLLFFLLLVILFFPFMLILRIHVLIILLLLQPVMCSRGTENIANTRNWLRDLQLPAAWDWGSCLPWVNECMPVSGQGFTNNPIIRLMVLKSTCSYYNDNLVCTLKLNNIITRWLIL